MKVSKLNELKSALREKGYEVTIIYSVVKYAPTHRYWRHFSTLEDLATFVNSLKGDEK